MKILYILIIIQFGTSVMCQSTEDWTKERDSRQERIRGTIASMIVDQPGWSFFPTNPNLIVNQDKKAYLFIEQKIVSLEEYESVWMDLLLGDIAPTFQRDLTFLQFKGKLLKSKTDTPTGEQVIWLAYLGDENQVIDIKGAYPMDDDQILEPQTLKILRSLFLDDQITIGMFEAMPFTAEVEKYGFTEEDSYAMNNAFLTNPESGQNLQISLMGLMEATPDEIIAQELERLNEMDVQTDLVTSEKDGVRMDLLIYQNPLNSEEEWTYSAMIFQGDTYLNVTMNMSNTPENLQMFQQIIRSVKMKSEPEK
ncbi:MAG: hypothetical protein K9I85_08010 [Saprospiraceae bacterium]|nr:hypothetical protein [Saprospiraceae bacterium]